MPFDHAVSLATALCSFIGLMFVAVQLRDANRQRVQDRLQRESESIVKLYDINRQLISLAIDHPALLKTLEDEKITDLLMHKRYLQLWLNQLALSYSFLRHSVVHAELRDELQRNLVDFMSMKTMQKHWHQYGSFYPSSFQHYVNGILKSEPPVAAAHSETHEHHDAKT